MSKRSKIAKMKATTVLSPVSDLSVAVSETIAPTETVAPLLKVAPENEKVDPLKAVAMIPKGSPEPLDIGALQLPKGDETTSGRILQPRPALTAALGYPEILLAIGQANALCMANFAGRYAAARTAEDIVVVTSDFYKEQGRLFKRHAEDILNMFSL